MGPADLRNENEKTPVETLRESARKRRNAGIALLATGITFAAIFGLSALAALWRWACLNPVP